MIEEEKDPSFAPNPELRHSERGLWEGLCISEESEDAQTVIKVHQSTRFAPPRALNGVFRLQILRAHALPLASSE